MSSTCPGVTQPQRSHTCHHTCRYSALHYNVEAEVRAGDKIQFSRHAQREEALDFYYIQIPDLQRNWRPAISMLNEAYSSEAKIDTVTEKPEVGLNCRQGRWRQARARWFKGTYQTHRETITDSAPTFAIRFFEMDVPRKCSKAEAVGLVCISEPRDYEALVYSVPKVLEKFQAK